jgi:hypothetical protein
VYLKWPCLMGPELPHHSSNASITMHENAMLNAQTVIK